jgi:hypothetical protein
MWSLPEGRVTAVLLIGISGFRCEVSKERPGRVEVNGDASRTPVALSVALTPLVGPSPVPKIVRS